MFSLGWMEFSIILIISVLVFGPKELPTVIRFIKKTTSKIKGLSKEFTSTINEVTDIDELKEIKKDFEETKDQITKDSKEIEQFIEENNSNVLKKEKKSKVLKD